MENRAYQTESGSLVEARTEQLSKAMRTISSAPTTSRWKRSAMRSISRMPRQKAIPNA